VQPIEESTTGASLLAQIIVDKVASYLLIDGATLSIRRVESDIEREIKHSASLGSLAPIDRKNPSGRHATDAIAYTQTTCSTGAMPTPQLSAANTMDKPCSPTWQAFTLTQPHKPGNKN
jgi:hypothetical protein